MEERQTGQKEEEKFWRQVRGVEYNLLEVEPKEREFLAFFKSSLDEGIRGISVIEKFGKSETLAMYANTLEEWDEMIGGTWQQDGKKHLVPEVDTESVQEEVERKVGRGFHQIGQLQGQFSCVL